MFPVNVYDSPIPDFWCLPTANSRRASTITKNSTGTQLIAIPRVNFFHILPQEIVTMIYGCMNDIADVKATLSTCKKAKEMSEDDAKYIAKMHIFRMIGFNHYRVAAMIAPFIHDIGPADMETREASFREYYREGEWPVPHFTTDIAGVLSQIPAIMNRGHY
ncbi:hypothetical protein F5Y13DRAFT_190998 [Hypoxylon sp. FL1857]|nr:hypothetical protein F5Y13DRAFT_190998 [Hypoxylon sp. FL1857]